jgi:hypothetical protein
LATVATLSTAAGGQIETGWDTPDWCLDLTSTCTNTH